MSKSKTTTRKQSAKSTTPALPVRAIHEIADWTFALARRNADGDVEDVAAIERVRRTTHAAIDGRAYRTPTERDLLSVVSLIVTAAERDLGIEGLSDAMASSFDVLTHAQAPGGCVSALPVRTCPHRAFQHIGILSLEFHVDKLSRPLL